MNQTVPDITPGYPSKGQRIGPAWVDMYAWLKAAGLGWTDGTTLAARIAANHEVSADTLKNILSSARNAGLLEATHKRVDIPGRGPRMRTHYRIKEEATNGDQG